MCMLFYVDVQTKLVIERPICGLGTRETGCKTKKTPLMVNVCDKNTIDTYSVPLKFVFCYNILVKKLAWNSFVDAKLYQR